MGQSRSERWLFVSLVVLACVIVSRGANSMRGDSPHYLAASQSLLSDFDTDLRNQYAAPETLWFVPEASGDVVQPARDGALRLLPDSLGFAAALIPAYAAAGAVVSVMSDDLLARLRWDRTRAARDLLSLAMALLYGWTAVLAYRLTRRLAGGPGRTLAAVIIAFLTPPLLSVSFVVVPDVLAAALLLAFALAMTEDPPAAGRAALVLAAVPWLGAGYALAAAAGVVWLGARGVEPSRHRARAAAALPAASLAVVFALRWWSFGSLWPGWEGPEPTTAVSTVRGAVGLLFDRDSGLFVLAPFWALALAGAAPARERRAGYAAFAAAAFAGVWLAAAFRREWWGGDTPPGRPLVAALPLVVPLLAGAFGVLAHGWGRALRVATVGWAGVMTITLIVAPARMWPGSPKVLGLLSTSVLGMDSDSVTPSGPVRPPELRIAELAAGGDARGLARYLDGGGEVDARTPTGRTPLLAAVQGGRRDAVDLLIEAGADVDAADGTGWTPLMVAVRHGRLDLAQELVAAGADVNATSLLGWSPLVWAAYDGADDLVRLLIDAGADVEFTSPAAGSALVRAAEAGHLEVVRTLLEAGADASAVVNGRRAAEWAALNDRADVVEELRPR